MHHTGNLINRCLKSLENLDVEKIVITSSLEWTTKDKTVKILHTRINEPTAKRNIATFYASGKYICFMDDDVEIGKDCIDKMVQSLETNHKIGMIYATLLKTDNHNIVDTSGSFLSWNGFLYETYVKKDIRRTFILSAKSACCMIRRNLFYTIGCFDNDYVIYGEETDLSWRVWQLGYKVIIRNDAIAYHAAETNLKPRSYYNQHYIHYHGCKNYITTLIKNLPPQRLYIAVINFMIWLFMGCCLWIRDRRGGKWIFQGLWYNIKNFRYIWKKRMITADHSYWKLIRKDPQLNYYFVRFNDYLTHKLHS